MSNPHPPIDRSGTKYRINTVSLHIVSAITSLSPCHAIALPPSHLVSLTKDSNWPVTTGAKTITEQAIIFGLGSMFNHSTLHQNVGWERDVARGVVVYKALRDIEVGEELCWSTLPLLSQYHNLNLTTQVSHMAIDCGLKIQMQRPATTKIKRIILVIYRLIHNSHLPIVAPQPMKLRPWHFIFEASHSNYIAYLV